MVNVIRILGIVLVVALAASCAKRTPAPTPPPPPPPAEKPIEDPNIGKPVTPVAPPTKPSTTVVEPKPVAPIAEDSITNRSLEELSALLKPVFFGVDKFELDSTGQAIATANAEILRKNTTWKVTIEGHADERGTPEYNLALGERRAVAVRDYLVSLGVGSDRLKTLSYGEEFPFDAGHNESAWGKNRRAYFQITAK